MDIQKYPVMNNVLVKLGLLKTKSGYRETSTELESAVMAAEAGIGRFASRLDKILQEHQVDICGRVQLLGSGLFKATI